MNRASWAVVAVAVVILAASTILYVNHSTDTRLPPEYRWGRGGTLELELALERNEIAVNESLNYTITITNVGKEKVRLYVGYSGAWSDILDEDNRTPRYYGPLYAPPPRPDDAKFNSMMTVLEPGANYTQSGRYGNSTAGAGHHDLRPGHAYHVTAGYFCHEDRPYPALPHWLGGLEAGPRYFSVRGQ